MSPQTILNDIAELSEQLKRKRAELETLQDACMHSWGPVTFEPPRQVNNFSGYGVQWPPHMTEPKWTRQCPYCLKMETTTRSKPVVPDRVPDFEPEKPMPPLPPISY